jgi:hypothetical protein
MKKQLYISIVKNLKWLEKILSMGNAHERKDILQMCRILDFLGGYRILNC